MKINALIFTVLVSVAVGVGCILTYNLPADDPFPDYRGRRSPISKRFKPSKVRYTQTAINDQPTTASYMQTGISSKRSVSKGASSSGNYQPSSFQTGINTGSTSGGIFTSSSRMLKSYNNGSSSGNGGNSGLLSGGKSSSSLLANNGGGLSFGYQPLAWMSGETRNNTSLQAGGNYQPTTNATQQSTRRRIIIWTDTDGAGHYWEDDEEEYVTPPTYPDGTPIDPNNPPTIGDFYYDGSGNQYIWNGTDFNSTGVHSEINSPIGDGVWILLILAVAMVAVRRKCRMKNDGLMK